MMLFRKRLNLLLFWLFILFRWCGAFIFFIDFHWDLLFFVLFLRILYLFCFFHCFGMLLKMMRRHLLFVSGGWFLVVLLIRFLRLLRVSICCFLNIGLSSAAPISASGPVGSFKASSALITVVLLSRESAFASVDSITIYLFASRLLLFDTLDTLSLLEIVLVVEILDYPLSILVASVCSDLRRRARV